MERAEPLPDFLIAGHRRQRAALSETERARQSAMAREGQAPRAMVIACCDSRVMVSDMFGARAGELFVHRNIASLVPACAEDGRQHGTSATIEFAVEKLRVRHLVVMGHSGCGGVEACYDSHCRTHAADAAKPGFTGAWLEILGPSVPKVAALGVERAEALRRLEHEAVLVSLRNLLTFPFVRAALDAGALQLHGVWKDIARFYLEVYDPAIDAFARI